MNHRFCVFLTLAIVAAAMPTFAQGITTHKVSGNIYMLEGRGGNIGVSAGKDGILVIDTQFDNMAGPIRDAIKKLGKGDIEFIINTHFHGDHTGGNKALAQDAPVIAHENARTRMLETGDLSDQAFSNSLPWVTFDDDLKLHFNGEEISITHLPTGHTDTDCVIYFAESNVAHLGDHFFNGFFPFIDLASGGDVASYMNNVQTAIDHLPADVKIIPGHGPLADLDDLKAFKKTIDETVAIIKKGIEDGKTEKQLQDEGLPEKYASAGTGFINTNRWISIVYQSLTR